MTQDAYSQLGLSGASYVGTGQTFNGEGAGIEVLAATDFVSLTGSGLVNTAALVGPSIAAGSFIPGKFTQVVVSTGLVAIRNLKSGNTVA